MDNYIGHCVICGNVGEFIKNNPSFREGYQCPSCKASLRYRGQAESIINTFTPDQGLNLIELANKKSFNSKHIYEPGLIGPFRNMFSSFKHYTNSFYWDDVDLGDEKDGVICQSLESLTYDDNQFDLMITSDILEHVRHPWVAFKEIFRVLKPGGYHIFSIPLQHPMKSITSFRVDTTTDEDNHIETPHYHGNGIGGKSLVYTDFGADIEEHLTNLGYIVNLDTIPHDHHEVKRLITFKTQKPEV